MLRRLTLCVLLGFSCASLASEGVSIGDEMPLLPLNNQFDEPWKMDADVKQIIFSGSKSASDLMSDFMSDKKAGWLTETHRVYLADIHKMPSMITRMVALPKMKKLNYPIVLGREASDMALLPRKEGCLTLIGVDNLRIAAIEYLCAKDAVNRLE